MNPLTDSEKVTLIGIKDLVVGSAVTVDAMMSVGAASSLVTELAVVFFAFNSARSRINFGEHEDKTTENKTRESTARTPARQEFFRIFIKDE